jgi:hypothetical protein
MLDFATPGFRLDPILVKNLFHVQIKDFVEKQI